MDALIPEEIPPEGFPLRGTPYVVLKRLGKGAQGMALLVKNPDLARLEVMKILLVAYNEELGFRFKFEAQAIAAIVHGAIVRIHSVGILPDQRPYFTMEYFEGETLSQRMRSLGGPMPVRRALLIATQLAEGLTAAHAKGIVHRDLKPGNILIAPDDSVKIIDFGIAKRAQEHTQLNGGWTQGNLIGTPTFMAPEQAMGTATAIGPATDIYALGCVLYMLLTNRLVYEGNTAEQIYHKLHTNPPTLAAAGTGGPFPPELEPLLRRMLERDPAARLQTAPELRQELNRILKVLPAEVSVPVSSDAGFDAPTLGATYSTAVRAATPPPDLGNFPTVRDAAPVMSAPSGWHDEATVDSPVVRGAEVTAADSPVARVYREPAEVVTAPVAPAGARRGGRTLLVAAMLLLSVGAGAFVVTMTRDLKEIAPKPTPNATSAPSTLPMAKESVDSSKATVPAPAASASSAPAPSASSPGSSKPVGPVAKPSSTAPKASASTAPSSAPSPTPTPKGAMDDPF